uniref:Uncharacterized protein n=1 Tax=Ditylenchus dipsaci TaxID=166011 RepID=A0A915DDD5_9BILA
MEQVLNKIGNSTEAKSIAGLAEAIQNAKDGVTKNKEQPRMTAGISAFNVFPLLWLRMETNTRILDIWQLKDCR